MRSDFSLNYTKYLFYLTVRKENGCCVLHINQSGLRLYPVICVVVNPVRAGLLNRTRRSEGHLQRKLQQEHENKTKINAREP